MTKRKGSKWEKQIEKDLQKNPKVKKVGRTVDSGRMWFDKGDLTLGTKYNNYCIEAKETDKKGFRVSKKLLDKLWEEALDNSKLPLIILRIQDYKLTIQIGKITGR